MKDLLKQILFFWKNDEFIRSKEIRRTYFLGVFIIIAVLYTLFIAVGNIILAINQPDSKNWFIVGLDFFYLAVLGVFFRLSNTRFRSVIAHTLLIGTNLSLTFFFPNIAIRDLLFLFALPTMAASFLVKEYASLPFGVFSLVCYLLSFVVKGVPIEINHLFVGGIIATGLCAWYLASRLEYAMTAIYRSEEKYQSLVDKNPLCVYEIEGGRTGKWTFINSRISDLLGYTIQEWLAQPGIWLDSIRPQDRNSVLQSAASNTLSGITYSEEYSLLRKSRRPVWVNDTYSISLEPGKPALVQGVLFDITRRKRAEIAQSAIYRISQAAYAVDKPEDLYALIHRALSDLMPVDNFYIALYNPEEMMIHFPYFVDEVDITPGSKEPGRGLTEFVLRTGQPLFAPPEVFNELVERGEVESIGAPSVDWLGVPLKVRERTIGVMAVQSYTEGVRFGMEDLEMLTFVSTQVAMVIERKRAEVALQNSEYLYHTTIDALDEFVFMVDCDLRVVMANQSFRRFNHNMGFEDAIEGRHLAELYPFLIHPKSLMKYSKALNHHERLVITETYPIAGREMVTEVRIVPLIENGKVERLITLTRDITLEKLTEKQIKAALQEKEVLLREVHHRVKNNLQVMSSLISLETDYVTDPQARRLFAETQSRVRSMAIIHEELYQSKDLARVNFADYIHRLTSGLMQIYAAHPNIDLHLDIAEVYLGVDTAIPCGLIINELMTNALKYAFPNGRPGVITVVLETNTNAEGKRNYILTLQDNGIGLPTNFNFNNTTTLGLQLVSILIAQLKGEIKINSHNGTQFTLLFSEANSEKTPAVK